MASITFWTRIEPFSRLDDIDTGLQARTHDPLWLLARQWQTGEFQGEDAGTPVLARFRLERSPLARFRPGPAGKAEPYRSDVPLETLVEREPVQRFADPRRDLRVAAEAGLYFLRLLERFKVSVAGAPGVRRRAAAPAARDARDRGRRRRPPLPRRSCAAACRTATASTRRSRRRCARRRRDAEAAARAGDPRRRPSEGACRRAIAFLDWFDARYSIAPAGAGAPSATPTWISERLEYSFAVSAKTSDGELAPDRGRVSGRRARVALVRPRSRPDARRAAGRSEAASRSSARSCPAPVRYSGMAADRFWELEDGQVNLNRIEGDPDELMRLLLVEFALAYGNDWFTIPVDATPGARLPAAVARRHRRVRRAHGRAALHALGAPAARVAAVRAQRRLRDGAAQRGRALPAARARRRACTAIRSRRCCFIRDELLEPRLGGRAARAEHRRRRAEPRRAATATPRPIRSRQPPDDATGDASYRLATTVPDYWIPFQPQRIDPTQAGHPPPARRGAARRGRRARVLRSRSAASSSPSTPDLSLFEEEVPRGGVQRRAPVRVHPLGRRLDVPVARPPQERRRRRGLERPAGSISSTRPEDRRRSDGRRRPGPLSRIVQDERVLPRPVCDEGADVHPEDATAACSRRRRDDRETDLGRRYRLPAVVMCVAWPLERGCRGRTR